jgi:hypothetical protein
MSGIARPREAVASASMTSVQIRCGACGRFFETKKARRMHIDKEHRITDADIRAIETADAAASGGRSPGHRKPGNVSRKNC